MELSINEVWEQAVTLDQSHGVDAVTVATTRMIEDLKARDHNGAAFWSAVANRLIEIQKIKMNIMPTPLGDQDKLAPFAEEACTSQFPIASANEN
jgi:hypothetical protein